MGKNTLSTSFGYAIDGVIYAFWRERNMKIHLLAAIAVVIAGIYLGINRLEWGLLSFTVALVIITEVINTAIEKTVDLVTDQYHPLAKLAKNMAAGAVLLSAINALIMAYIIFGTYLIL